MGESYDRQVSWDWPLGPATLVHLPIFAPHWPREQKRLERGLGVEGGWVSWIRSFSGRVWSFLP